MPIPTRPVTDAPRTLPREHIYAELLDAIVRGELPPGSRLLDDELSARFGSSRTPIREALARLAAIGLVVVEPRRATYVAPIDDRRARETLDVVIALSARVVGATAVQLDDAERDALRAYRDRFVADGGEVLRIMRVGESDGRWFSPFFRHYANPVFSRIVRQMDPTISRYASHHADAVDISAVQRTRAAVIDAALDGDGPAAAAAMSPYAEAVASGDRTERIEAEIPAATARRLPMVSEVAEEKIRLAILDGTLVPGEALPERELLDWLQMSRTPVRAALQQLELDGLVELTPHHHARVSQIDRDVIRDSMEATDVLHALSAARAPRLASPARRAEMRAALARVRESTASGDRLARATAVGDYTRLLDLAGGNLVLLRTSDRLRPALQRFLFLDDDGSVARAAQDLFGRVDAAIDAGDGAAAAAVLAQSPGAQALRP